jgi:hypothetical protein
VDYTEQRDAQNSNRMNSIRSAYHYFFGAIPLPPPKYHSPPDPREVRFAKAVGCVAWLWVLFHFKNEGAVLLVCHERFLSNRLI